ncbi:MAG: aminoacetone oxidase family FAD-binding enzyme [Gemmatimonadaceae bacterium]|nr:aminoacetone oxidase family FAD-binding enzyme [Gemmatimonadaceae bacterium]
MAAIFAASTGAEVLLLERTAEGGRKILISGGGRCNILPSRLDETRFITDSSPNTLRKIVRSWPLAEQIRFFDDELRLALVEEVESAKLFPSSNRARDVRDGLIELAARHGTQLLTNTNVSGVLPLDQNRWRVTVIDGESMDVDAVIIASGGLSVPKTGSDGLGLHVARKLGHTINKTYPALTPITADPNAYTELAGISLPVTLTAHSTERSASATGGFLFTHRGYSGPSVLDVSHVAVRSKSPKTEPAAITVRWSELDADAWTRALRRSGNRSVRSVLRELLPDRLADVLLYFARVDVARTTAELTREERTALVELLTNGPLPWTGDEGYAKAEVTGGGVSLAEIDPRTMESRLHRNFFLCGELLDAFGPIGGYNFLWAWATGRAAGIGAADAHQR